MSLLKIIANEIEVDFVKETLNIRKENNALIRDFKVSHSSYPFLLIENKNLKLALGPREITSADKTKTIAVTVFENDISYSGELQIISYLKGYRKANLKFASPLLDIMSKKIADFMPVVSVTGITTSIPAYVEQSETVIAGFEDWPDYVSGFINQGFPTVKWNFPTMLWKNKFGQNIEADDAWISYKQKVNFFIEDIYQPNTYQYITPSEIEAINQNVAMPQVYLLSPLFYALESIGFNFSGDFAQSNFIKKIMLLSFKDNLTKITLKTTNTDIVWDEAWIDAAIGGRVFNLKREIRDITESGTYSISIDFTLDGIDLVSSSQWFTRLVVRRYRFYSSTGLWQEIDNEVVFRRKNEESGEQITGEFTMDFETGERIQFDYYCIQEVMPLDYTVGYRIANADKDFYEMHPTIQLGRYLPDWTLASYLNNLKNWFNLNLEIDDLTKKLEINFNEDWIKNQKPEVLNKSMAVKSYDASPYDSFLLKFENDEDTSLWIDNLGAEVYTNQISSLNQNFAGKFKFIPSENSTSLLSDALEEKDGLGLIIYDEEEAPFTSDSYQNQTLKIEGAGGIYETYWKLFLKFRLNASILEVEGGFTKTEIGKFIKAKRIYFDHQDFVVSIIDYSELNNDNYRVVFKLESVNL